MTTLNRKRVNLMIDPRLLTEISEIVPSGKRSDFVNEALEDALRRFSIQKAFDLMDASRGKMEKSYSTEDILNIVRRDHRF